MKRFIPLLILFFPIFLFSQDCKYQKNEIDKFTGQREKLTKSKAVLTGLTKHVDFSVYQFNDTATYLMMHWQTATTRDKRDRSISIDAGKNIYLLLQNDEVVKLTCVRYAESSILQVSRSYFCDLSMVSYRLTKEQAITLMKHSVQSIRIDYTGFSNRDQKQEYDIKSKRSGNIKKVLACIF